MNARGALACAGTVRARVRPHLALVAAAPGVTIELAALHVDCDGPAGDVDVTIEPSGATVTLHDDGAGRDAEAGDGIYTATWVVPDEDIFTLRFPDPDAVAVNAEAPSLVDPAPQPGGRFG